MASKARTIDLVLPGREQSYRVLIRAGLRFALGRELASLGLPNRVFIVSDRRVAGLYGGQVTGALEEAGCRSAVLTVAPGERAKTWPVAARLAREFLALGADRRTPLIALGGGVVGDLTGFVASIFMRGVPFIQVPTTLLAMVDAAIGGKTAVNLPEGKNLLGTFYQPRLVIADPDFLRTLPPKERLNGLAEILKHGFIRDPALLDDVAAGHRQLFRDQERLADIICRAGAIKARVVAADEREAGLRRILNFGHTLGHALEAASRFRLPHGQAVAWGMLAALELSRRLTGLSDEAAAYGRDLIKSFGLARKFPAVSIEAVLSALPLDKKREGQNLVFVLLEDVGKPVIYPDVSPGLAVECLRTVAA
ncbi:MAG: 3-dehydroquinate synthase [Deltaproteobacteria bacterium]|nr:3-dehydroquinate synthase [Deltaproteobacteria bacterium]